MKGLFMRLTSLFARVLSLLILVNLNTFALEGIVVQTVWDGQEAYLPGKLIVKTLSTGEETTLEDGGVYGAAISPDGSKVAYVGEIVIETQWALWTSGKLVVVNIDGTQRTELCAVLAGNDSKEPSVQWCADGYIYWSQNDDKIYRIAQSGGSQEVAYVAQKKKNINGGDMVTRIYTLSMSLDGTKAIWTKPPNNYYDQFGWSNTSCNLSTSTEYELIGGCQATMSPDGTLMGRATGTHTHSHLFDWDLKYEVYDPWHNSYGGCGEPDYMCPAYLDIITYPVGTTSWLCRWSTTAADWYLYTSENSNNGYLHQISTDTPHLIGHGALWDYFPSETTGEQPEVALTPALLQFTVETGATTMPAAKTVTLAAAGSVGAAQLSGAPAWLNIEVSGAASSQQITNTLMSTNLPAVGSHQATITVTVPGLNTPLSYQVNLVVSEGGAGPITIASPSVGSVYHIGDTLLVTYTAPCEYVPSVVLELSVDGGNSWGRLSAAESESCGENQTFKIIIPNQFIVDATQTSTLSDQCVVQVKKYPAGNETRSGVFNISAPSPVSRQRGTRAQGSLFVVDEARGIIHLSLGAPAMVQFFDMQGKIVLSKRYARGAHVFPFGERRSAVYVVQATFNNGNKLSRTIPIR